MWSSDGLPGILQVIEHTATKFLNKSSRIPQNYDSNFVSLQFDPS